MNRTEISKSMQNYNMYGEAKIAMDRIQIEQECCGSDSYADWFRIPWNIPK